MNRSKYTKKFVGNQKNIPSELKELKQWVLADSNKKPYQPNGQLAKPDNPETWSHYDQVIEAWEANHDKYIGVGFVFNGDYTGIDLDSKTDVKAWEIPLFNDIIEKFNSYTEISQSGKSLHLIVDAKKPGKRARKGYPIGAKKEDKTHEIEIYDNGRYFLLTGDLLDSNKKEILPEQAQVSEVYNSVFATKEKPQPQPQQANTIAASLPDQEIITKMFASSNGDQIQDLYNGSHSYTSPSEADFALCSHIAFYSQDPAQIDRIFRTSKLYRQDKWSRKDYRETTINKAINTLHNRYTGNNKGTNKIQKQNMTKKDKWQHLKEILSNWNIRLRYNELNKALDYTRNGKHYTDSNILIGDLLHEMGAVRKQSISAKQISEMLVNRTLCKVHNPIKEFIGSIPKWDGKDWFRELCEHIRLPNDEDSSYFYSMLRKHFIRSIRCAIEPDNVNRYVTVFYGGQNIGKTLFWRWATPKEIYSDEPISLDKDSYLSLARNITINLDELDELNRKDLSKLKAFISKGEINRRVHWGKHEERFSRVASIVGSSNKSTILTDTQNSRWIILKVKEFGWRNYTKEINPLNLWSQALAAYKANHEAGELSENEKAIQAARNDRDFLYTSTERELIEKYFCDGDVPYTATEILTEIQDKTSVRLHPATLYKELKRIYGDVGITRVNGKVGKFYYVQQRSEMNINIENNHEQEKLPF